MLEQLRQDLEIAESNLFFSLNGLKNIEGVEVIKTLGKCDLHGGYAKQSRQMVGMKNIKTETICPECAKSKVEAIKNAIDEQKKQNKANYIKKLINKSGIPKRFEPCSFENFIPGNKSAQLNLKICKSYAEKWLDRFEKGGGMVMVGLPGTGKNHLAVSIMKEIINNHQHYALITSVSKIIRNFRYTWSKDSDEREDDVIAKFSEPDLLVIDEIGVQYGSDSEKLIIFEIINNRYEEMLPTILISNEARDNLVNLVGERVIDRMKDGGGCELVFDWESYRK